MHRITLAITFTIAPNTRIKAAFAATHILQYEALVGYNYSLWHIVVERFTLRINTIIIMLSNSNPSHINARFSKVQHNTHTHTAWNGTAYHGMGYYEVI